MRELVLNHASLGAGDRYRAVERLKDVISGMAALVRCGAAGSVLRSARDAAETPCAPGVSLYKALEFMRNTGARDEYRFFARLTTKFPLLSDVGGGHRFFGCEIQDVCPKDGAPLLLCALEDHVAVGFPTQNWDRDRIAVRFKELLSDETFSDKCRKIDHLSRSNHAEPICRRYREKLRAGIRSGDELWRCRRKAFPHLMFGLDVEDHVANRNDIPNVIGRLSELDDSAASWNDGPVPTWTCHVTNESISVRQHPRLKKERRFRTRTGAHEFFYWHARLGSERIHLRFDAATREVEIGYIGTHLPL